MRRAAWPLSALLLAACVAAPPPAPIAVVAISPPIAATETPVVEAAPAPIVAPAEPREVALPAPASCVFSTASWDGTKDRTALRVHEGGAVFATFRREKSTLYFPAGSTPTGAVVEIADARVALRGLVAGDDIWLRPSKPVVMGGAVIPMYGSRLVWAAAATGAVTVTFDPHEGITLAQPPLSADVPCDALSLDGQTIDAASVLPKLKTGRVALLPLGAAVPLALTEGGATLATLAATSLPDSSVTVLDTAGKSTRIAWEREASVIFGWVPTSALTFPKKRPERHGFGTGYGSGGGSANHHKHPVVCPDDVTLFMDVDDARWRVGRILANTVINLKEREGAYQEVWIHGSQISLQARMTVLAASVERCPAP